MLDSQGLNHISADNDDDEGRWTSHSHHHHHHHHHHQQQQHFNKSSSPWQRDVSATPNNASTGYRPVLFNRVTN